MKGCADVAVSSVNFDERHVEAFASRLDEKGVRASIRLIAIEDENLSDLTHPLFSSMIVQNDFYYFAVIIVNNDEITINPREVQ